jgi:hypothetical protein
LVFAVRAAFSPIFENQQPNRSPRLSAYNTSSPISSFFIIQRLAKFWGFIISEFSLPLLKRRTCMFSVPGYAEAALLPP